MCNDRKRTTVEEDKLLARPPQPEPPKIKFFHCKERTRVMYEPLIDHFSLCKKIRVHNEQSTQDTFLLKRKSIEDMSCSLSLSNRFDSHNRYRALQFHQKYIIKNLQLGLQLTLKDINTALTQGLGISRPVENLEKFFSSYPICMSPEDAQEITNFFMQTPRPQSVDISSN